MSKIDSYMDGRELRWKVTVGRKTYKGFHRPSEALRKGIEQAQVEDPRCNDLLVGKSFERQVGIVFGADIQQKYCTQQD